MTDERAAALREEGEANFGQREDLERHALGLEQLVKASAMGDAEAAFIIGWQMFVGRLRPEQGDREETAMQYLALAGSRGSVQARSFLNIICSERYRRNVTSKLPPAAEGPLTGFDGKPIHIDRKGILTPVDAKLSYVDGENVLTFQANIRFFYAADMDEETAERFERAVIRGFMAWQGQYEVFGGQKLKVVLDLTQEDRALDNVVVCPVGEKVSSSAAAISGKILPKKRRRRMEDMLTNRRSFASIGVKRWSVRSRKVVWIQSDDGQFRDEEEIFNTAKHEFGHVLGLGDLYASEVDELRGVERGAYAEIDSFHMFDKLYHLVMCDASAPVSNNDIEMAVLAFSEDKFQAFQPEEAGGRVSEALGRGN